MSCCRQADLVLTLAYDAGMSRATEATMDSSGRIVIPSDLRRKAGLKPGVPLQVTFRDGHVEIEPLPRRVHLVRKESLTVAEPEEESEQLTNEQVCRTLEDVRHERGK